MFCKQLPMLWLQRSGARPPRRQAKPRIQDRGGSTGDRPAMREPTMNFITSTYVRYFALIVVIAAIASMIGGRWPQFAGH
jgi:hypothetical protein